jgi:hypothetical protein
MFKSIFNSDYIQSIRQSAKQIIDRIKSFSLNSVVGNIKNKVSLYYTQCVNLFILLKTLNTQTNNNFNNNFIIKNSKFGNILLYWNNDKKQFEYYMDEIKADQIEFDLILEEIAKKYAKSYNYQSILVIGENKEIQGENKVNKFFYKGKFSDFSFIQKI